MPLPVEARFVGGFDPSPARRLVAITPNDATDLSAQGIRSLYVGTGGTVVVLAADDSAAVTLTNVLDGSVLPIQVAKVLATGTTATNIVGLL